MWEQNLHLSSLVSNSIARAVLGVLQFMVEVITYRIVVVSCSRNQQTIETFSGEINTLNGHGCYRRSRCQAIPSVVQRFQYTSKMDYSVSSTEIDYGCSVVRNHCVPNYARFVHNFYKNWRIDGEPRKLSIWYSHWLIKSKHCWLRRWYYFNS